MAVLLGIAPFILLEWGLQIADIGRPTGYVDPFVGFGRIHPLFELNEDSSIYQTVRSRQRFFSAQGFAATKAGNGFRIFCLGGSTVHGRPYQPATSFSKWLELELSKRVSSRAIEVINCGGISYASYRLLPVLEEILTYEPDLIVIATGHNEFLEDRTYHSIKNRSSVMAWAEDRIYSLRTVTLARDMIGLEDQPKDQTTVLAEDVETRLDSQSGYASYHFDAEWRTQVVRHYEQSLRAMVELCREADVPLILVKLGSNLRDCPPFKSEHKPGLDVDAERIWQTHFEEATQAESEDLQRALSVYHRAEAVAEQHALLAFRIARCLDQLDRHDEARPYYVKAMQWDVCPLRMLDEMHAIVENVAAQTNTLVVDAQRMIAKRSPNGIPGHDWYVDHVHPTVGAHQQIARTIIAQASARGLLPDTTDFSDNQRREIYRRHLDRLGDAYLRNAGRRIEWLENWARRQRLFSDTLPSDVGAAERYGHRQLDLGDDSSALATYKMAIDENPATAQTLFDRALALFKQGRTNTTRKILELLRTRREAEDIRSEIEIARLIVALDGNRVAEAAKIYEQNKAAFEELIKGSSSEWLAILPDALSQAEALYSQQSH